MADPKPTDRTTTAETLLARVALGDRAAFEALYQETSSRLFGICLRVLNERAEAEEVLQEVYTSVWRKAGQFDPTRASAMSWLSMMARNKSIDRLRDTCPPQQARALEHGARRSRTRAPRPRQQAEALTDRARLEHCLQQLEPKRHSLIRAAFFDGSPTRNSRHASRRRLGSVKSWIRRGLLQLRTCLES